MPDPTTGPATAALAEIRERDQRVWNLRGNVGGLLAINEAKGDVPRLLAALDRVMKLTAPPDETGRDLDGNEEHGLIYVVRCDKVREAITSELAKGEGGTDA